MAFFCRTACTDVTDTLTALMLVINRESVFSLTANLYCTLFMASTVSDDSDKTEATKSSNNLSFNRFVTFFAPV
jgi:hypothetical protein